MSNARRPYNTHTAKMPSAGHLVRPSKGFPMKQILIITGDGGEAYETWFAVHRFQEAGYATRVAAPS